MVQPPKPPGDSARAASDHRRHPYHASLLPIIILRLHPNSLPDAAPKHPSVSTPRNPRAARCLRGGLLGTLTEIRGPGLSHIFLLVFFFSMFDHVEILRSLFPFVSMLSWHSGCFKVHAHAHTCATKAAELSTVVPPSLMCHLCNTRRDSDAFSC